MNLQSVMNHHLLKKGLLWHFVPCSGNNGCDKPRGPCTTRHLRGMNGLRWAILACVMASQASWIIRRNCTMVSGGWVTWPYLAISEVPRQCLMGYRTMNTLSRAVYGLYFIYGSPVWGRLRKERRCTVTQWNLVARHCLFRMGPRYGRRAPSINRPRWFRMVCVDIRALWRSVFLQQFLWMVSTDPIGVWANMPILWGRGSWR